MRLIVDVKESKAAFMLELLNSFSFVKTKPISPYKSDVLDGIQEAVESMKLVKQGKLKPRPAKDLLNEL